MLGDVTHGSRATAWVLSATKFVSWEATSSLQAHSEGFFGETRPPRMALFGLCVVEKVQPIQPTGWRCKGAWLDPSLGRAEGQG